MNENNSEQLIKAARERLQWYALEAPEDKFDEAEVNALVNLLNVLEPIEDQENERALERFHAYVRMRGAEESNAGEQKKKSMAMLFQTRKFIAAVAGVLVVILIAGGTHGAVNASKDEGFFHWLTKDSEGATVITSPENIGGSVDTEGSKVYLSVEEVPEEYRDYLFNIESIGHLNDYELDSVSITPMSNWCMIQRLFVNNPGKSKVCVGSFIYPNETILTHDSYFKTEVGSNMEEGAILKIDNPMGMSEYAFYFYIDNIEYCVEGNIDEEILKEITTECRDILCN